MDKFLNIVIVRPYEEKGSSGDVTDSYLNGMHVEVMAACSARMDMPLINDPIPHELNQSEDRQAQSDRLHSHLKALAYFLSTN